MSGFQKDLAISYIYILAINSVDFRPLPISTLSADVELTDKKARDYLRSMGCKVKSKTSSTPPLAELSAPLKFPMRMGMAK
jgi:hypothetical protein